MTTKEYEQIIIIWKSLNKTSRVKILWLLSVICLSAFLEMLSIASVIPFIESLTYGPEYKNPSIDILLKKINIEYQNSITIYSLLMCITVAFSGLLKLWVIRNTTKIAFLTGAEVSNLIFNRLLNYEYFELSKRSTSEIINLLSLKIHSLINSIIIPIFYILNSIVVIIVIITGLFIINPELTFLVFVVYGTIYYILSRSTKEFMLLNSKIISEKSQKIITMTQEIIAGIKDIILNDKKCENLEKFSNTNLELRKTQANSVFFSNAPRPILESIALILLGLSALFFNGSDKEILSLSAITVIAIGTQKLLPMMQLVYSSINSYRENKHVIDSVSNEILNNYLSEYDNQYFKINNEIIFKDIIFKFNESKSLKIKLLNIQKGRKTAIIGTSGVGKTTLLNIILGLLKISSGEILSDGYPVNIYNNRTWFKRITHVPQHIHVIDGSIAQNILYSHDVSIIDIPKINECLSLSMLDSYVNGLEYGIFSQVGEGGITLSGGLKQRLGIARALYKDSDFFVFDEATSALDEKTETVIIENIFTKLKNKTIIFVTHKKKILVYFDDVFELKG